LWQLPDEGVGRYMMNSMKRRVVRQLEVGGPCVCLEPGRTRSGWEIARERCGIGNRERNMPQSYRATVLAFSANLGVLRRGIITGPDLPRCDAIRHHPHLGPRERHARGPSSAHLPPSSTHFSFHFAGLAAPLDHARVQPASSALSTEKSLESISSS
jgi:hypothetical protein